MTKHYGLPNALAEREQEEDIGSGGNMDIGANQNSIRESVHASQQTAKAEKQEKFMKFKKKKMHQGLGIKVLFSKTVTLGC